MLINTIKSISLGSGHEFAEVISDFDLLLHVEYPILYTGRNKLGHYLIGSFLEEDEEDLTSLYYIHFLIKNTDYLAFVSGKITYRDIFRLAKNAFILRKDLATSEIQDIFLIAADDIPNEYWPHKKSFYPKKRQESSLSYKVSLQGGLADSFRALSKDLIEIQTACSDFLYQTIEGLPKLDLNVSVYESVATIGSFQLNFEVDIKSSKPDLFFKKDLLSSYQNSLIEYTIKNLSGEAGALYSNSLVPAVFQSLVDKAKQMYSDLGRIVEDELLHECIKDCVRKTASNIIRASNSVGTNYDTLSFLSVIEDNNTELIATVTSESNSELISAVNLINDLLAEEDNSFTDAEPKIYKVYIYNLNTKTRNGTGITVSDDGTVSEPRISIVGADALDNTRFTESLHSHKIIDVMAIGTIKDGRVKKLLIDF